MNDANVDAGIKGSVAQGFESVRAAFAQNFARDDAYRELGAALAVYWRGEQVVDLWGGHADAARSCAWQRDSLVNVYSSSKGVSAVALAMLVEEGKLDYAAKVTKYWPEFGQAGKENTTVAQLLSHQAGLTGFTSPISTADLGDWQKCCEALAQQAPFWAPGENASYHAMTWGYLAGEVFRRAAGKTIGSYIAERISQPLKADVFIGLPKAQDTRVAQIYGPKISPDLSKLTQPPQALAALVNPQLDPQIPNQRSWRAAEIPAANGQASAQGLARIYGALAHGGELEGAKLLSPAGVQKMLQRQTGKTDLLLGFTDNWGMGMCFNQFGMLGPRPETFGHGGWGGSLGCADLETGVGIGYVMNQMGDQLVGDPRPVALLNTIFACL